MVAPRTTKRVKTFTPERWARVEELFHRAAECDVEQRAALLEEACRNDLDLRHEVEELLSSDRAGDDFHSAVRAELGAFDFPLVGETVSHYRILQGLGGGGMGLVYRAEDIKLGRQVAIKFLPEESSTDPTSLGRFEREARSASALENPNICPIYEFGEHEGRPFLVMQLLEGQTLRELISASHKQEAPFELSTLLNLAIQILDGLDAAHGKGIVHRDIKPANIFITKHGQAKILDFGLAKLTQGEALDDRHDAVRGATRSNASADLFLSRTGVAMGTAGYMSPEQVRGDKVDARTDLFSYGLVLYEIATGKHAFAGETGPLIQDAILNQTPPPVREVNPATPAKLERIINKALEKNLQSRYQTAADIRADLENLRRKIVSRRRRWWAVAAGGTVVFIATTVVWLDRHQSQAPPVVPEVRMRQLTGNPDENPAHDGMISPNGEYLAYTDAKGLHVKLIETGETRDVLVPAEARDQKLEWTCAAWFPDSSRFLANTISAGKNLEELTDEDATIWLVSLSDAVPRRFRGGGIAWSISPDGTLIAFAGSKGRLGPREIWLMDANGEHGHKLFESGDEGMIGQLSWSADGHRVTYVKHNEETGEMKRISRDLKGGPPVILKGPAVKDADLGTAVELGDGRMVFAATTPDAPASDCNFWVMRHDLSTGNIVEQPRRLTNWTGFCMWPTSATADGKKLVFTEVTGHTSIYMADLLSSGTRTTNLRRFTMSDRGEWPCDWTPDNKTLIFHSFRDGHEGLYRQSLNDSPELLVSDSKYQGRAKVSPDGKWLIYIQGSKSNDPSALPQLMRVPINGGAAQKVFTLQHRVADAACSKLPSTTCAIAERTEDRKEILVTAFDPIRGRGAELARISTNPNTEDWDFELSPDGTRIALLLGITTRIKIFSIRGRPINEIEVAGAGSLVNSPWAPDGKALFVAARDWRGSVLLRVGLDGRIETVIGYGPDVMVGLPSPDGRKLALMAGGGGRNVWMMENF